jgi:purine-nucleoside phosphorylase
MRGDYRQTSAWLKDKLGVVPLAGIILGTGLNDMVEGEGVIATIPYADIPGFVSSTAPSHKGNLVLARISGKPVVFLQGRFHYYEGYAMRDVVFPTRVLASMGIGHLIVTNASGSLRKHLGPGSIVQITDHINHMGTNPLIGENDALLGERFPSMNHPYDPVLRELADSIANALGIKLEKGVYVAVSGPSLETKAECGAFASWGADLVGMSTVPEVIAARHAGMRVCAFSIVTNYSNLFHDLAHSQEDIRKHAGKAGMDLKAIIGDMISRIGRD